MFERQQHSNSARLGIAAKGIGNIEHAGDQAKSPITVLIDKTILLSDEG
jgi:hypothetical protein